MFTTLTRTIAACLDQLSIRLIPDFDTKFVIIKPACKPSWVDRSGQHQKDKRNINHSLDRCVKGYSNITVKNANEIRPTEFNQFDQFNNLSGAGFCDFWSSVNNIMKISTTMQTQAFYQPNQDSEVKVSYDDIKAKYSYHKYR